VSDVKPPQDYVSPDPDAKPGSDEGGEGSVNEESKLEENIKSRSTWLRLLFMILFAAIWSVSRLVVAAVVATQFVIVLFTGASNSRLRAFGQSLATYSYQLVAYLTFVTEEQPFPFNDWPSGPPE
jgi:cytoskeletal protein RodZ